MNIDELEGDVLSTSDLEKIIDNKDEPMPNRVMAAEIVLMRGLLKRACENMELTVLVIEDLMKKFSNQMPSKPQQNIRKLMNISNRNITAFKEVVGS